MRSRAAGLGARRKYQSALMNRSRQVHYQEIF
jgi:hypothetical protein